jgi:hypothetical protein
METGAISHEYLDSLIKSRSRVRILGWVTLLLFFSVIGTPVALVTGAMFFMQRKKFKKTPFSDQLKHFVKMRRSFTQGLIEGERRFAAWQAKDNELKYKLSCLKKSWGAPLYFKADAVLCELHIESDSAPKGPIEGSTALFADNTATQMVTTGAVSGTTYKHKSDYFENADYNRIESSTTNTTYIFTPVTSGSASVQISGPKLIPGVLLFETASEAQQFTNTFNAAARATKEAKANLPSKIAETEKEIKAHEKIGEGDFGAADLLASLDDLPAEVRSWIVATADSQRTLVQFTEAIRVMRGKE